MTTQFTFGNRAWRTENRDLAGNLYDMTSVFTGLVDDVRVTARALKPDEFGPLSPAHSQPSAPANNQ